MDRGARLQEETLMRMPEARVVGETRVHGAAGLCDVNDGGAGRGLFVMSIMPAVECMPSLASVNTFATVGAEVDGGNGLCKGVFTTIVLGLHKARFPAEKGVPAGSVPSWEDVFGPEAEMNFQSPLVKGAGTVVVGYGRGVAGEKGTVLTDFVTGGDDDTPHPEFSSYHWVAVVVYEVCSARSAQVESTVRLWKFSPRW
jgi:hypothetical protein